VVVDAGLDSPPKIQIELEFRRYSTLL